MNELDFIVFSLRYGTKQVGIEKRENLHASNHGQHFANTLTTGEVYRAYRRRGLQYKIRKNETSIL